jgi:hypothetical protein
VLPESIRCYVEQVAASLEVAVDLPGVLALGVLATACMRLARVKPRPDWTEPLNLYIAAAMGPGENKSATFRKMFAPIYQHEAELVEQWKETCKKAEEAADKKDKKGKEPRLPARPRWLTDDITPEKMAVVLEQQGERMTLASEEGTVFDIATGIYAKDGRANVGVFLKGHDGGSYYVDRTLREPVFLRAPLLTLALAVQPSVIQALAKRPDLRGRGMWGRFLYSYPRSLIGSRTLETPPIDPLVRGAYERSVLTLARQQRQHEGVLSFTPEASRCFLEANRPVEAGMGPGGELDGMRDWAGKWRGAVARLAGLLHLADHPEANVESIEVATVEKAIVLGQYFLAHAQHTFNVEMAASEEDRQAQRAWEVIERKGWERVTPAQLARYGKGPFAQPKAALAALQALVERGYLAADTAKRGKGHAFLVVADPAATPDPGDEENLEPCWWRGPATAAPLGAPQRPCA